ncbi:hypothetical protein [Mesorhizobium sp. M6A.T.Ce.TU.016.01.1.1]|uniref:hypothetical protein n=1 Tax=Mesorhizobium sp. M6A.T.Ce.TU.016.01.1.1 TaxID=2496783 RepID=UPI000FCCA482|nr:hypothetical protein [Mesorhizobium sp. M6A.T.Ce.TU.016.01.1.1]RUU29743.1 hypothetical protein EOC94_12810 [Mesorhizobium sp. M6A.T.Ce.TU.016.01.1.1]
MKAADLEKARLIAGARTQNIALRDRLADGEVLSLNIGEGSNSLGIVLMPRYVAGIRADLIAAFNLRISENDAALAALGVESDG